MEHPPRGRVAPLITVFLTSAMLLGACGGMTSTEPTTSTEPNPPTEPTDSTGSTDSGDSAETRDSDVIELTQRGLSGLEVGGSTSVSDVEAHFDFYFANNPQTDFCTLWIAEDQGIAIIASNDTATMAIVVEDPRPRTAEGIGVGSTFEEVTDAYGGLVTVLEDPSQTGGPIVVVDDLTRPGAELTEDSRLMAFDTDTDRRVTRVRVGMWPWVGYSDYCSDDADRATGHTGWPLTRTQ